MLENREIIYFCILLKQAQTKEEKIEIKEKMKENGFQSILDELSQKAAAGSWEKDRIGAFNKRTKDEARALDHGSRLDTGKKQGAEKVKELRFDDIQFQPGQNVAEINEIDLASFEFEQGDHLNSNKKFVLPPGTWEKKLKGYEEVHVPPLKPKPFGKDEHLIAIDSLPKWAQAAFGKPLCHRSSYSHSFFSDPW